MPTDELTQALLNMLKGISDSRRALRETERHMEKLHEATLELAGALRRQQQNGELT